jgi:membrane-bound serine protease (ClpP class)
MKPWLLRLAAALAAALACGPVPGARAASVGRIKIDGPIGPATAGYIARALHVADARNDVCLVIQLDTPGGLLDSTKTIVQTLYQAAVPTVVYVAPSGAGATSAGCFITMAADVAAMAPNTTIGAAHPVLGFGVSEKLDDVMKEKLENFAASSIQAIAEKRGRNAEWAKSAVRESASITAKEALELKVIDLIAADMPDLLKQLNGRPVNGKVLQTAGAAVADIPMIPREKLFQMLWRPEIMLLLMLAAIYGIIGELSHPGAILPGVAGGIALVLLLYMSATLPVNVAGLGLIVLALALFIVDLFAPTHGVLTFGGIVAFFLGALMLFNGGDPAFRLSLGYLIPATLVTAAFFVFIAGAGVRAQFLPVRAGKEAMVGKRALALQPIDSHGGRVFVEGEYWNALSEVPAQAGQEVVIVGIAGLTLRVKPAQIVTSTSKKTYA